MLHVSPPNPFFLNNNPINFIILSYKQQILEMLLKPSFRDYGLRNLQARIVANLILKQILQHELDSQEFTEEVKQTMEPITEKIAE